MSNYTHFDSRSEEPYSRKWMEAKINPLAGKFSTLHYGINIIECTFNIKNLSKEKLQLFFQMGPMQLYIERIILDLLTQNPTKEYIRANIAVTWSKAINRQKKIIYCINILYRNSKDEFSIIDRSTLILNMK